MLGLFEAGDSRALLYTTPTATIPAYTRECDALHSNIKLLRVDEMLLTRAGANFQAGTTTGATPPAHRDAGRHPQGAAH